MSSFGELYITEDCTDAFESELNKAFGKEKWRLDPGSYANIWRENQMPTSIEVNVLNDMTDEIIGRVEIESKQRITTQHGESYVEISPKKIKIINKVKKK